MLIFKSEIGKVVCPDCAKEMDFIGNLSHMYKCDCGCNFTVTSINWNVSYNTIEDLPDDELYKKEDDDCDKT